MPPGLGHPVAPLLVRTTRLQWPPLNACLVAFSDRLDCTHYMWCNPTSMSAYGRELYSRECFCKVWIVGLLVLCLVFFSSGSRNKEEAALEGLLQDLRIKADVYVSVACSSCSLYIALLPLNVILLNTWSTVWFHICGVLVCEWC